MEEITSYPCIVEVSQSKDFDQDPETGLNIRQVCIGKAHGKYICLNCEEARTDNMLHQLKKAIQSGGIGPLYLSFWNYARIDEREQMQMMSNRIQTLEERISKLETKNQKPKTNE